MQCCEPRGGRGLHVSCAAVLRRAAISDQGEGYCKGLAHRTDKVEVELRSWLLAKVGKMEPRVAARGCRSLMLALCFSGGTGYGSSTSGPTESHTQLRKQQTTRLRSRSPSRTGRQGEAHPGSEKGSQSRPGQASKEPQSRSGTEWWHAFPCCGANRH